MATEQEIAAYLRDLAKRLDNPSPECPGWSADREKLEEAAATIEGWYWDNLEASEYQDL